MNVFDAVSKTYKEHADKILLCDQQQALTGHNVLKNIQQYQQQLIEQHIGPNDKVALYDSCGLAFWLKLLAIWSVSAIAIPIRSKQPEKTKQSLLELYQPALTLTADDVIAQKNQTSEKFTPNNTAIILSTSGSTGAPKGVPLTHQQLLHNAKSVQKRIQMQPDDRLLLATSFSFVTSLSHFLVSQLAGAELIGIEQPLFQADLVTAISDIDANCFGGSPLQAYWLSENLKQPLRWLMSSGDHLHRNTITTLRQNYPSTKIHTVYGLTELGGRFCTLKPELIDTAAGAVGTPIEGLTLCIITDEGKIAPANSIGHIVAAGELVFSGYYQRETPELDANGFRTGDMGYIDDHGLLHLSGRSDQVVKCAGQKVSMLAITEQLIASQQFADAIAIAVADEQLGHIPCVFYVTTATQSFNKGELLKQLRLELPSHAIPRVFIELDAIPRTDSGKPNYAALKTLYSEHQSCN